MAENILGVLPIPKLLRRFALPSIISMLVNSVYNIVDQIFIGHRIGYIGNGATSVSFPFVTFFMAISLLIGVGTAANVGLNLGRKDQKRADLVMGNGIFLALTAGLMLFTVAEIFLIPLLRCFGATDIILPYAVDYSRIYIIGVIFVTVSIVLSDLIRADGSPSYAMISMLSGAILNVILDYVFMYPLDLGMRGAALASIIGQFLNLFIALLYLRRFRTLNLRRENLRPDPSVIKEIFSLGLPSFITQFAGLLVSISMNQQAVKYGALTEYGSEIPVTVFGIVMKVNSIMLTLIMGTTIGAQPIFSYNYGARNYRRVRQLAIITLITTSIMSVCGTLAVQLFPQQIISAFGQEDALYNEFATHALIIMTIMIFILGIQMTSISYFQAIGKPKYSLIVSICRQIGFMLPLLFILPLFMGLDGIMYSFVFCDIGVLMVCTILLLKELKDLNRLIKNQDQVCGSASR